MLFSFNTKASGKYKFYTEDNYGNLVQISETPNLITNNGLDSIVTQTWADAFTHILVGTGTTPASATDTDLESPIGSPSNSYPSNPASYTLASYDSVNGVTYRLGRSFKIDNPTSNTYTITEVGTSNGDLTVPGNVLFSRALLTDPVTLFPFRFIYAIYELRLETGTSTTTYEFQPETDTAGAAYAFPTPNSLGIINNGFAKILIDGSVTGKNFTAGEAILEPSTSNIYLYKMTTPASTHFADARTKFETDPTIASNPSTVAAPTYARFGYRESVLYDEVLGTPPYDPGSHKRARHIIVAPTGAPETIHGFVLSNIPGTTTSPYTIPANLNKSGIHCAFSTEWNRPIDSFVKIYFEHNWHA